MSRRRQFAVPYRPSMLVIVVAAAVTVFFMVGIVREALQSRLVRHELVRLRDEVAAEQQRQTELKNLLTYLSSPTFQESQARLQLGLQAPGEKVIVVPSDQSNEAPNPTARKQSQEAEASHAENWYKYFFGPRS